MTARPRDPARQAEIDERRRSSTRLTIVTIGAMLVVMLVAWAASYVQRLHADVAAREVALRAAQARIEQLTFERDALRRELASARRDAGPVAPAR